MGKIIRKDATITPTGTDEDFPGTFQVILSAPTKDRDGETLLPSEWKQPLPDHITFDQDHAMTVAGTVGSGTPHLDEDTGNLVVDGTYSSLQKAQDVRTLVNEGHIRTTSVAFMSERTPTKDGKATVTRELLNGAFVAIPSNREAMVLSSKSGARNSKTDAEHVQSIHDHALALGAEPADAGDKTDGKPVGKSLKAFVDVEMRYGGTKNGTPAVGTVYVDVLPRYMDPDYKALAGSLEAVQERASNALRSANDDSWLWLRGTVPDGNGGGYLVYDDGEGGGTFKQEFTDDGETVALVGEPVPVSVEEVVSGSADHVEDDGGPTAPDVNHADGTAKAATPEGAPSGVSIDESEALEAMKKRAYQLGMSAQFKSAN